jgi:hypothetical protein
MGFSQLPLVPSGRGRRLARYLADDVFEYGQAHIHLILGHRERRTETDDVFTTAQKKQSLFE